MYKLIAVALLLTELQGCTVARATGNVVVGAGQLALGAVDVVL